DRVLADEDVVAGVEAIANRRPLVERRVRADARAFADPERLSVRQPGWVADDAVAVDDRAFADLHVVVDDRVRTDLHVGAEARFGRDLTHETADFSASTTAVCCSGVISANIGSERISRVDRSASGKSPALCPRWANAWWR